MPSFHALVSSEDRQGCTESEGASTSASNRHTRVKSLPAKMTAIQKARSSAGALLRTKAVSAPLGASVKARLCGSGKGQTAGDQKMVGNLEPNTVNLAAMVHAFIHDVEAEEVKMQRRRMCGSDDEACTSDCDGEGEGCGSGELAQVLKVSGAAFSAHLLLQILVIDHCQHARVRHDSCLSPGPWEWIESNM
jgi:hypothetical protein